MQVNLVESITKVMFDGCNSVIKTVSGIEFEMGDISISKDHCCYAGTAIIIGIFGDFRGQVYFTIKRPLALRLAKSIIGEEAETNDEYFKGALTELCNMIMGNVMGLLGDQGINVDITPPTVITGDNISLSVEKMQMIRLPLQINDCNEMNMCIAISLNQ